MGVPMEMCMTRYPKNGKGFKWTVKELSAISFDWKGDTINDSDGLFGEVRVASNSDVSIAFRYGYKLNGKKVWFYCGTFPGTDIAKIREVRDQARQQVSSGIDPSVKKQADRIKAQAAIDAVIAEDGRKRDENLTIQDLYDVWIKDGVNRSDNNAYIQCTFNKHALPLIGSTSLKDLSESQLLALIRGLISKGTVATAVELSKGIKQMLVWAEKRKPWRALLIEGNPADLIEVHKLVPNDYTKERDRVLSHKEIHKLKNILIATAEAYKNARHKYEAERPIKEEVQIAVWICLSTLCRIGELMKSQWKHVDFENRTWFIPKELTKGTRGNKQSHTISLSDFSLQQLRSLHKLTGDTDWLFPATNKDGHVCIKSASKQIGDRQIKFKNRNKKLQCRVENDTLVIGDQEWTPHDLRRTGATMMQELGVTRDVINLCQNHVIGSKIDRHYLHYQYADEKMLAWIKLGDHLTTIFKSPQFV